MDGSLMKESAIITIRGCGDTSQKPVTTTGHGELSQILLFAHGLLVHALLSGRCRYLVLLLGTVICTAARKHNPLFTATGQAVDFAGFPVEFAPRMAFIEIEDAPLAGAKL